MTLLSVDWLSVGVKAGQFILSFSILVTLHELGHFIPAKLFNCRVDKFYLFFDPVLREQILLSLGIIYQK